MKNRKLSKTILQMAKVEQKVRKGFLKDASLSKELEKIDASNLKKLKKIVKKFGWPTVALVGNKASHLAWLLIQHADKDVNFQKHCLKLIIKAGKNNDFSKADIAFLTDRVLVNSAKPQLYGTQFYESEGKLVPRPIKDADKLNERREKMGLETFEVYKNKLSKHKRRTYNS